MPRHFALNDEGTLMFVADQNGNTLELFEIDGSTGFLTKKETIASGNNPTFIGLF